MAMAMDTQATTNRQRAAALVVVLLSAAVSLGLMLWVGRHNASVVLILLFTVWVASPFAGLLYLDRTARRWQAARQQAAYWQMHLIGLGSVAIYAAVALLMHLRKPAAPFLAVPAATWMLIAAALWTGNFKQKPASK